MGRGFSVSRVLPPDLARVLGALLATAAGTAAGILVDSGFGLRESIVNAVYRMLGPLFDAFSAFPNGQLVVAGFIYRIPIVLIAGLAAGLVLRHFRFPRLLLCSVFVWPIYLLTRASPGNFIPELALYSMQYAFLVFVIRATDAVSMRDARRKDPAAT